MSLTYIREFRVIVMRFNVHILDSRSVRVFILNHLRFNLTIFDGRGHQIRIVQ